MHDGQSTVRQFGINSCLPDKFHVFIELFKNISCRLAVNFPFRETDSQSFSNSLTLLGGVPFRGHDISNPEVRRKPGAVRGL